MKKNIVWMTCASFLLIASQSFAQDPIVDKLLSACEADINNYCNQVTPGEGRLLHCMAAHEDKISGQCGYALYQAATLMEQMAAAIVYIGNQCAADIEKHCSAVAMGEGRILMCLEENAAEVSGSCKQAITDTVGE
ncbi:MAG: hypothetical protein DRR11_02890 [Gammaproteobacteria bacterium]|nr:MAG: hypothetical protein DRR11_02890 [Gammaproteobacteria bacterium]RLA38057.1 MAG: hypothetical protein DRR15_00105 [Gammaproteobacteria bacterium]